MAQRTHAAVSGAWTAGSGGDPMIRQCEDTAALKKGADSGYFEGLIRHTFSTTRTRLL